MGDHAAYFKEMTVGISEETDDPLLAQGTLVQVEKTCPLTEMGPDEYGLDRDNDGRRLEIVCMAIV